ncbi:DNA-binding transcriptional MerR regulator [Nocardia tenerifensis]|uniref:DNA-binding transcriptional MerR regulator n=1 Tax=Nocardia tenerifensis TaxID=228006 RepID=A0A318JZV4_9NOCA|nr:MerR family transcriptional regulator [Nocardia tenerifensis]PXX63989.1 DNA-binding transcriptional MerR regulator [Nocardia tenerifensis]
MSTLKYRLGRTVDIARRAGYSVQQIRNLERDGVLPPATRTATGHRVYGEIHLRSALAYRALAVGAGPIEAKRMLRAFHTAPISEALAMLDATHARLHTERVELGHAKRAAASISSEPIDDVHSTDSMSIAELADALGLRTSTLRHWDAAGLVTPDRTEQGARHYTPDQVRDVRIVHQLRKAGFPIAQLRAVLPELRRANRFEDVRSALAARDARITARASALLEAAAELRVVISLASQADSSMWAQCCCAPEVSGT